MRSPPPPALLAGFLIAALFGSAAAAAFVDRLLYADGASCLLALVHDGRFQHVAWTRTAATFVTQAPTLLAMHMGLRDLSDLARIYGMSLYLPPLLAYAVASWLARRDPVLEVGNALVVLVCFFPTAMLIIGEFHVLYAAFWCAFMLLVTGRADRPQGAAAVLALAAVLAASYELAVLLCPLLMLAAGWRARATASPAARRLLLAAMLPLGAGAAIGAIGILVPRDPSNTGLFLQALRSSAGNATLLGLAGLVVGAALAGMLAPRSRLVAAAALAAACSGFGWALARPDDGPALGQAFAQRAQVAPVILAAAAVCGLHRLRAAGRGADRPTRFAAWPLLLPALLVATLDLRDSLGWARFMQAFCSVLSEDEADRAAFPRQPVSRQYGWAWTYPTLSALLRPAGSEALVRNPDPLQWQPFDPGAGVPDIDGLKARGGLCPSLRTPA